MFLNKKENFKIIFCCFLQEDEFKYIDENYHRGKDCAYIFELRTSKICPPKSYSTNDNTKESTGGLGAFSIILIM